MTDTIELTTPSDPHGTTVAALVLGGLGSRVDLPVDCIDELVLAVETAAASVNGPEIRLECDVLEDRLVVRVGPLEDGVTADGGVRRVLDALVDRVGPLHRDGREWIELEVARGTAR